MTYIGIDPGKSGALAYIINDENVNVIPFDEGNYRLAIRSIVEKYGANVRCCVESVSAMPGQGVTSMFNFGKGFSVTSDKNTSIDVCKRLFPQVSLLPSGKCRKDNDGMAEALLMAEYARRKM